MLKRPPQLRSRVETILNVAQRLRLRLFLTCGLVGSTFEHPSGVPEEGKLHELTVPQDTEALKKLAAEAALDYVKDGYVVGIGHGVERLRYAGSAGAAGAGGIEDHRRSDL